MSINAGARVWAPIIDGDRATATSSAVDQIAEELLARRQLDPAATGNLAHGHAGQALFFGYAYRVLSDSRYRDAADEHRQAAVRWVNTSKSSLGLYGGYVGVAFVLQHLRRLLDEQHLPDPCSQFDRIVLAHLNALPEAAPHLAEILNGLAGIGLYLLERPRDADNRAGLHRVAQLIVGASIELEDGRAWQTPGQILTPDTREHYPEGIINLGMAHGSPGILAVLAHSAREGGAEGIDEVVRDGVSWFWNQQQASDGSPRNFLPFRPMNPARPVHEDRSRLSWCYGDLSAALGLASAAIASEDRNGYARALALAEDAARFRPPGVGSPECTCICHGTLGLVHFFNRLYHHTSDPLFARASVDWLDFAFEAQRAEGRGVAGFGYWDPLQKQWVRDPGFLSGAAGVGLCLMGLISDVPPDWDRLLGILL